MRAPQHHISLVWPEPDEQHRPRPEDGDDRRSEGLGLDFRYAEEVLEEAVRELASAPLAGLEARIKRLEEVVSEQIAATGSGADVEFEEHPFSRWMDDSATAEYRGEHIAIHPTRGIIAHGDSITAVIAQLRADRISPQDVAFDYIPLHPAPRG